MGVLAAPARRISSQTPPSNPSSKPLRPGNTPSQKLPLALLSASPLGRSPRPCHVLQWKICDLLRRARPDSHQQQHRPSLPTTPPAHPGLCTAPCVGDAMRSMTADGSATDGARRKHLDHLAGIWHGAALPAERGHISRGKHRPVPAPDWSHCPHPKPLGSSSHPWDGIRTRDAQDLHWLIPILRLQPTWP